MKCPTCRQDVTIARTQDDDSVILTCKHIARINTQLGRARTWSGYRDGAFVTLDITNAELLPAGDLDGTARVTIDFCPECGKEAIHTGIISDTPEGRVATLICGHTARGGAIAAPQLPRVGEQFTPNVANEATGADARQDEAPLCHVCGAPGAANAVFQAHGVMTCVHGTTTQLPASDPSDVQPMLCPVCANPGGPLRVSYLPENAMVCAHGYSRTSNGTVKAL